MIAPSLWPGINFIKTECINYKNLTIPHINRWRSELAPHWVHLLAESWLRRFLHLKPVSRPCSITWSSLSLALDWAKYKKIINVFIAIYYIQMMFSLFVPRFFDTTLFLLLIFFFNLSNIASTSHSFPSSPPLPPSHTHLLHLIYIQLFSYASFIRLLPSFFNCHFPSAPLYYYY